MTYVAEEGKDRSFPDSTSRTVRLPSKISPSQVRTQSASSIPLSRSY